MTKRPLLSFFLLTFAITWGLGLCYTLFPDQLVALFGPISNKNPLFYLAVYAPSLAALIVTAYTGGVSGLSQLLSRLLRWRVSIIWYLVVFLGIPAILVSSGVLSAWLSGQQFNFKQGHKPLALYPVLISLVLDPGPLGEELGWRGFALPRLLHSRSAITASAIVGLVWGLWHLPAFFINGLPQNQFELPAFLLACVALSVLMTWVYQNTNGSILLAMLAHWLFNTDFLPRGTFPAVAALLTVAALAVVALTGPQLSRVAAKKVGMGEVDG